MSKFLVLNPELRELVGEEILGEVEKKIDQYRICTTLIGDEMKEVISQPEGQTLVIFIMMRKQGSSFICCASSEVPLDTDLAEKLVNGFDESKVEYIHPVNGIEHFPYYRTVYFVSKGRSIEAQVQRHNELIDAGLVDVVALISDIDSGS